MIIDATVGATHTGDPGVCRAHPSQGKSNRRPVNVALVAHRTNNGQLNGELSQPGKQLAEKDSGGPSGRRPEFTTDFFGRVRLHVQRSM